MVLLSSPPGQLGEQAPPFTLPDTVSDETFTLESLSGPKATVIFFICNHCPFVVHINEELVRVANDYQGKGVHFVAISSNDAGDYPQDGPREMKRQAKRLGYPFPYLYDETQAVAKTYGAVCTPDIFVLDGSRRLAYRGRLDGSRPGSQTPVDGRDLRSALNLLVAGKSVPAEGQIPSMGCSIKWKH